MLERKTRKKMQLQYNAKTTVNNSMIRKAKFLGLIGKAVHYSQPY